jgi:PAS domain S-box-containing protein
LEDQKKFGGDYQNTSDHDTSQVFSNLDKLVIQLSGLANRMQNYLVQTRSAAIPEIVYETSAEFVEYLTDIHQQVNQLEAERRNLLGLAKVGNYVNSTLELDDVLQIVMDTLIKLTGAERAFLMLKNNSGGLKIELARNWSQETIDASEFSISKTIINQVINDSKPILTTNALQDPRFTGQESVVVHQLRSILCVPLYVKGNLIGVLYADNRIRTGLFTQRELDLVANFANQAAMAIENARLFTSVRKTLNEVTELKNLMDNVFASIESGVITTDLSEKILLCNQAAGQILGSESSDLIGRSIQEVFTQLSDRFKAAYYSVLENAQSILDLEISQHLNTRGQVDLIFNMTPLKDEELKTQGVAIVLEDLTERKRLEAQRELFEKMVSPAVINQLDPKSLQLGGKKVEITTIFADIRGFTSFSEQVDPEILVTVLNHYLAAAADAILSEGGTIDKFMGDAVMGWFNAPIPQPDHIMRGIKAALTIRKSLMALHETLPLSSKLSFGIGIHVGEAVLGLVGTQKRMEYTAIGDSINTAKRIQENAAPAQILISEQTYKRIADEVIALPVNPINAKGKREPLIVYEIIRLR